MICQLLLLMSSLSVMVISRDNPPNIDKQFFAGFYHLSNNQDSNIHDIVPQISHPLLLYGISGISCTTSFGLTINHTLIQQDQHYDLLTLQANFSKVSNQNKTSISINILILGHFKLIQVFTFNISSLHSSLPEPQKIDVGDFNHVCLLKQFELSNTPHILRVTSSFVDGLYQYDILPSRQLKGWIVVDLVVVEQKVLEECKSKAVIYYFKNKQYIRDMILLADLGAKWAYLVGAAKMSKNTLIMNFSEFGSHQGIDQGIFDMSVLQLNMTCIEGKFGQVNLKAIQHPILVRSTRKTQKNYHWVLYLVAIIFVILLFFIRKKRKYSTFVEQNVETDTARDGTAQTQTERQITKQVEMAPKCAICQVAHSDTQSTPCGHQQFDHLCPKCMEKLKSEDACLERQKKNQKY